MRLRLRVLLLLGGCVVLLTANVVVVERALEQRDEALTEFAVLEAAQRDVALIVSGVVDQQAAVRSYVTTQATSYLRDYEAAQAETARRVGELTAATQTIPDLHRHALAIADAHGRWGSTVAVTQIDAMQAGDVAAARAHVGSRSTRAVYGEVRSALRDAEGTLQALRAETERRLGQARTIYTAVVYGTIGGALLLVLATAVLLRTWVLMPLHQLSAAVRAVAAGDHRREITLPGPPELADLAADAELMRREIVSKLEEATRAREALEQQGPTVLSLRSHLRPSDAPLPSRFAVGVRSRPAEGVLAGDWHDLLPLDERSVAVCVVDVAGHDPAAGVLALRAKQLLTAALRDGRDPGDTLSWAARQLGDTGELFLTAFIMVIDVRTGVCRYANAGHPPGYVLGGARQDSLDPTGPLLGPIDATWTTREVDVDLDSMILLCTDGALEARSRDREEFGVDRLLRTARAFHVDGPQEVAAQCFGAVQAYAGGAVSDDVTIIALALSPRRVHLHEQEHLPATAEPASPPEPV